MQLSYQIIFLLAFVSLFTLVFMIVRVVQQRPAKTDDSWRDNIPLYFQMQLPLAQMLLGNVVHFKNQSRLKAAAIKLECAGLAYAIKPEEMMLSRYLMVSMSVSIISALTVFEYIEISKALLLLLVATSAGYFSTDMWLRGVRQKRYHEFSKSFPFFLDLLVLSVRSGLNFSSALQHSVSRLPDSVIRFEFARVLRESRTGTPRREAMCKLGERIQLPAVANFIAAINQAEETGGEVGDVLLSQAEQRSSERFLLAEQLANQAPVKMLLPLIGLLFPVTFIIILFPIYIGARNAGTLSYFFK